LMMFPSVCFCVLCIFSSSGAKAIVVPIHRHIFFLISRSPAYKVNLLASIFGALCAVALYRTVLCCRCLQPSCSSRCAALNCCVLCCISVARLTNSRSVAAAVSSGQKYFIRPLSYRAGMLFSSAVKLKA
jgi:hypothetical protein